MRIGWCAGFLGLLGTWSGGGQGGLREEKLWISYLSTVTRGSQERIVLVGRVFQCFSYEPIKDWWEGWDVAYTLYLILEVSGDKDAIGAKGIACRLLKPVA